MDVREISGHAVSGLDLHLFPKVGRTPTSCKTCDKIRQLVILLVICQLATKFTLVIRQLLEIQSQTCDKIQWEKNACFKCRTESGPKFSFRLGACLSYGLDSQRNGREKLFESSLEYSSLHGEKFCLVASCGHWRKPHYAYIVAVPVVFLSVAVRFTCKDGLIKAPTPMLTFFLRI